jgi:hypothetical protein
MDIKKNKKIKLKWQVHNINDRSRISQMYCFKMCVENAN